jgi:hypothetical protein
MSAAGQELEAIMADLADDLRTAGPRFSLAIVPTWPGAQQLRRFALAKGLPLGEPDDLGISLRVDGDDDTQLVFWTGLDPVEQLADLLDQVQDVVAETLAEMWPLCPMHDHMLSPTPSGDHVAWQCPETGESIGRFGELGKP